MLATAAEIERLEACVPALQVDRVSDRRVARPAPGVASRDSPRAREEIESIAGLRLAASIDIVEGKLRRNGQAAVRAAPPNGRAPALGEIDRHRERRRIARRRRGGGRRAGEEVSRRVAERRAEAAHRHRVDAQNRAMVARPNLSRREVLGEGGALEAKTAQQSDHEALHEGLSGSGVG